MGIYGMLDSSLDHQLTIGCCIIDGWTPGTRRQRLVDLSLIIAWINICFVAMIGLLRDRIKAGSIITILVR